MLYLILAIFSSAAITVIMRLSARWVKDGGYTMLAMNYLTCMVVAGCYTGWDKLFPAHPALWQSVGMGAFNGVLYLSAFALLQRSTQKNGVVLSALFMKLGLLVPMAVSVLVFRETPGTMQILGFVLAVGAIVWMNRGGDESGRFGWGLLLLLLTGGAADAMSKVFEQLGSSELSSQFLYYTFQSALIFCAGMVVWKKERFTWGAAVFGVVLGLPNYFSTRFLLLALSEVPAVIAYPTYSVATILVVTLAGVLLFRERLEKRRWYALAAILLAIALLNL